MTDKIKDEVNFGNTNIGVVNGSVNITQAGNNNYIENNNASLKSEKILSEQAFSILSQIEAVEAEGIIILKTLSNGVIVGCFGGSSSKNIEYSDSRNLPDDLETLVSLGFLKKSTNNSKSNVYRITRLGSQYVKECQKN